ncbi:unnamed protein product [Mytilus coruscus]|uniref:OTU domain-containing protein n=1 Tax=Mytilus coruscus TaxID=42192 RepID=A0A6J8A9W8_MYTCO|nr:unnamed protein product [Mytilus coruscus]
MPPSSATKSITGDGNCLFRAISNRQEFFGNVRKAIVDHLIRNAEMFKSFLQPRFKTVVEHIQTLQMKENNVWGTELEIIACADLLKTDIYTFHNGSWIRYSSSQLCSKNKINVQAIYLQHQTGINHYEVVTAVTQKSRYQNRMQSSPVGREKYKFDRKYEVPTLKMNYSDDESKVLSKAEKEGKIYSKDEEFKARKTSTLKRKYWEDEGTRLKKIKKYEEDQIYRDNLIQAGIKKYREDKDYRDALKESGIQKYENYADYRGNLIQSGIQKYQEDKDYRDNLIQSGIQKYQEDKDYRDNLIQCGILKYRENDKYRDKLKQASIYKMKINILQKIPQ